MVLRVGRQLSCVRGSELEERVEKIGRWWINGRWKQILTAANWPANGELYTRCGPFMWNKLARSVDAIAISETITHSLTWVGFRRCYRILVFLTSQTFLNMVFVRPGDLGALRHCCCVGALKHNGQGSSRPWAAASSTRWTLVHIPVNDLLDV